jgi:hypothetical protein
MVSTSSVLFRHKSTTNNRKGESFSQGGKFTIKWQLILDPDLEHCKNTSRNIALKKSCFEREVIGGVFFLDEKIIF